MRVAGFAVKDAVKKPLYLLRPNLAGLRRSFPNLLGQFLTAFLSAFRPERLSVLLYLR